MKEVKTFEDITVEQFIALQGIKGETMEDQKKIIQIVFDVNADELSIDKFFEFANRVADIFSSMSKKVNNTIIIDEIEFHLRDIKDFSTKEFIDFDSLAKDGKENLLTLLALMYSNDDFDNMDYIKSIETKKELLKGIRAVEALGALDFFTLQLLTYVKNMVDSSPEAKEMMMKNPEIREHMTLLEGYISTMAGS